MRSASYAIDRLLTAAESKEFATLQAEAALHGGIRVDVVAMDNGRPSYTVSRWQLCTSCGTLSSLRALLVRMGVPVAHGDVE